MTERSGHSKGCEQAKKPPCECRCGGAEHGWQEAFDIAAASSSGDLLRREQEADQAWSQATLARAGQHKPRAQTAAGQQAAIKTFIAEVIRWLQRDPDLHKAIKQLGGPFRISRDIDPDAPHRSPTSEEDKRFVEAHVIPGLRKKVRRPAHQGIPEKGRQRALLGELLAQTAHALDEFRG